MKDISLEAKKDKHLQERFTEKFTEYPVEVFIQDNLKSHIEVDAHWHNCIEILFMITGSANQHVNGENFVLSKNDMIILNEGNIHSTICFADADTKILVIKFTSALLGGPHLNFKESKYIHSFIYAGHKTPYILTRCDSKNDTLKSLMMALYAEYKDKNVAYELYIKGFIYHIIAYLIRNNIFKVPKMLDQSVHLNKIGSLLIYIEQNFSSDISLKTASEFVHISYYYLSRLFKNCTGQNFKQYLDFVRVCEAEKMIIHTDKNITQIALDVGFSNISSFNRVFNRIRNYNPSELKKAKSDKF